MDVTYDYYRIFYYVAKYGSFSQAASALLRGQPNITKTISKLEAQLGCRLFARSSRGVTLTPEGEKLYRHVEKAFAHLSQAEEELLSERKLEGGLVSVAATEIGLYGALLPALEAFHREHPGVKLRLTNSTTPQALEAVESGLADFGVIALHGDPDTGLSMQKVREFREILCRKTGCLPGTTPEELFAQPYISLRAHSDSYGFYRGYLLSLGIQKEPDIEVATAGQVLPIVESGMGLGFVPDFLAAEALSRGVIEEVPLPEPPPRRGIYLARDKNRSLSIGARTLVQYLTPKP